jgi:hypothetical protein
MPGLVVDAAAINLQAGDVCRGVTIQIRRATAIKRFMDRFTAADLTTIYGISTADANILKSAMTELGSAITTFNANRVFIDQIAGLGDL